MSTIPRHVLAFSAIAIIGFVMCLSYLDDLVLLKGARPFLPEWFNSLVAERDVFDIWVDFIMENNPITSLVRLASKSH